MAAGGLGQDCGPAQALRELGDGTVTARPDIGFLGGIPRRYALWGLGRILLYLGLILLLIEGIFLAEELVHILERIFTSVGRQAHVSDVVFVLATRTPEIVDLALPMALLIAVYQVALRCREDREFVVLAGMGIGAHQVIGLAVVIGALAQLASLAVSGIVEPHARYLQRSIYFEVAYRAFRTGSTVGQFFHFPAHAVLVLPDPTETAERRIFIRQHQADGIDRLITAQHAELLPAEGSSHLFLRLNGVVADDFERGKDAAAGPLKSMQVDTLTQPIAADALMRMEPRGRVPAERTSWELLRLSAAPGSTAIAETTELGRRWARGLLCLLAPLIGALALTFTTRASQVVALPAACAALMAVDIAATALAADLAAFGVAAVLVAVGMFVLGVLALLLLQLVARQHALIRPAGSR